MENYLFSNDLVKSNRIIYTPSQFAKQSLLYLQETGDLKAKAPHISRRNQLSSYLFFMVLEGHGTMTYQNKTYHLKPHDCIFIDCHKCYEQSSSLDLWHLKWVHFNGPMMDSLYQKYIERGGQPVFTSEQFEEYISCLDQIFKIADSLDYIKDMMLNEQFSHLLSLLMKDSWNPEQAKEASQYDITQIKKFIDENVDKKIQLDDLANMFFINKFYLTRRFKEKYDTTINAYINQVKITQAKRLLRFSNDSIETIAHSIGIDDANYFSRLFKKIEGTTPGQYRKLWSSTNMNNDI